MLPDEVLRWEAAGRYVQLAGLEVFVVDLGEGPATVVLHGFPSSWFDLRHALPSFGGGRRIVLLDFPGFGLSEKPERYSYSLFEQTDVVEVLLRELDIPRCAVVSHDMGTSVACELAARRERGLLRVELGALLLMNGSVHIELSKLTPSQKVLRTPLGRVLVRLPRGDRMFRAQMRRILSRPLPREELDAMWAQIVHRDGRLRLPATISYIGERYRFWDRWIGALRRLDVPAHVLWAPEDPVAVIAIGELLAREIPGATFERLEGLGHYPQLEDPRATGEAIARFLSGAGF